MSKILIGGRTMRYFWIPAILLVALLGCGGRDAVRMDTAAPNSARSGDVFQPAVELFDGNVLSPMVDADVGEILNGPGTGGDVGTPWADSTGRHWAVAVALQRLPASTSCRIAYRFLGEGFTSALGYVPVNPDITVIRLPKVVGCYFQNELPHDPFIEVAVAFQYRTEAGDWDIGVVRLEFDPNNFPGPYTNVPFTEVFLNELDNIEPDIAYRPTNGDIYIISVTDDGLGDADLYFTEG